MKEIDLIILKMGHKIDSLESDKKELLEMLSVILPMFTDLDSEFGKDNPRANEWTEYEIEMIQKISDLIQKHE